jgi:hypothetical protein
MIGTATGKLCRQIWEKLPGFTIDGAGCLSLGDLTGWANALNPSIIIHGFSRAINTSCSLQISIREDDSVNVGVIGAHIFQIRFACPLH